MGSRPMGGGYISVTYYFYIAWIVDPLGEGYISVTYYFYITWILDPWEEVTSL